MKIAEELKKFLEEQKGEERRYVYADADSVFSKIENLEINYGDKKQLKELEEDLKEVCDIVLSLPKDSVENDPFLCRKNENGEFMIRYYNLRTLFNALGKAQEKAIVSDDIPFEEKNAMKAKLDEIIHNAQMRIVVDCKDNIYRGRISEEGGRELDSDLNSDIWNNFVKYELSSNSNMTEFVRKLDENFILYCANDKDIEEFLKNKDVLNKRFVVKLKKAHAKRRRERTGSIISDLCGNAVSLIDKNPLDVFLGFLGVTALAMVGTVATNMVISNNKAEQDKAEQMPTTTIQQVVEEEKESFSQEGDYVFVVENNN